MIAFVDNDVVVKLAACDLIPTALGAISVLESDVRVLTSARFSLYVNKSCERGKAKWGADAHARICRFIQQSTPWDGTPDDSDMEILKAIDGVDEGEAVLLASCARLPDSVLLTGDKKSLRALSNAPSAGQICSLLTGRIFCVETLIALSIKKVGFAKLTPQIIGGRGADKALTAIFASGLRTTEASAMEGLASYEADLRSATGGLLRTV